MQQDYMFRRAGLQDKDQVRALGMAAYGQYESILTAENRVNLRNNVGSMDTWVSLLNTASAFICEHNGSIVGMAFLVPGGNPWDVFKAEWAYIRMVAVQPGYEGQGIARRLTAMCIDYARGRGEKTVALHTSEFMDAARHIYESLGFKVQEEIAPRLGKRYWLYLLEL